MAGTPSRGRGESYWVILKAKHKESLPAILCWSIYGIRTTLEIRISSFVLTETVIFLWGPPYYTRSVEMAAVVNKNENYEAGLIAILHLKVSTYFRFQTLGSFLDIFKAGRTSFLLIVKIYVQRWLPIYI